MALSTGTQAPDFTLTTKSADGLKKITLSEEYAKGPVVVLFFPMAFTGGCTQEFCSVTAMKQDFSALKATVLGVSGDNPFAQAIWAEQEKIGVSLLSDYEHEVAKAYDVAYQSFLPDIGLGMGGVSKRAAFVVDTAGNIVYAESNDDPGKMPNFAKIKEVIAAL